MSRFVRVGAFDDQTIGQRETYSLADQEIAQMAGLRFYIDATVSDVLTADGREMRNGARVTTFGTDIDRVEEFANFEDLPAIRFIEDDGGLMLPIGSAAGWTGYTVAFVGTINTDKRADVKGGTGFAHLMTIADGSTALARFRLAPVGMNFFPAAAGGGEHRIAFGDDDDVIPAGSQKAVWIISYDGPSMESGIKFYPTMTDFHLLTHSSADALTPDARFIIGGHPLAVNCWVGVMRKAFILDLPVHKPGNKHWLERLELLMAAEIDI